MALENASSQKSNATIDIVKLIMAFLVVGIHTEPFGGVFWLDKGFGIITRMCVPFFFVASSYFFFRKEGSPFKYVKRLFILYALWSLIYLPFDIPELATMSVPQILVRYLWNGNDHALWYLCGSIAGFLIVYLLSKFLSPKKVLILSLFFLLIGCLKSTYAPVWEELFTIPIYDFLGSRNGLFYAFPYYAMGLFIAKRDPAPTPGLARNLVGFAVSFILLCVESVLLVLIFHAETTILWISVFPLIYNLFMIVLNVRIPMDSKYSRHIRQLSTIIYVTHGLYMILFSSLQYWQAFLAVSVTATVIGSLVILLSQTRAFRWLKVFY